MTNTKPHLDTTTLCIIDTHTHALAARAMRITLSTMDFRDALFLSDSARDTGGARHIAIPPLAGREAYSRFVIKELLPHVETEHVLLIQWDGYVINPAAWSADLLHYDYIGARWGFHNDAHNVGNGGFSLRSRRLLEALADPAIDPFEPEDERICRHYRPLLEARHGIRFAPADVARRIRIPKTPGASSRRGGRCSRQVIAISIPTSRRIARTGKWRTRWSSNWISGGGSINESRGDPNTWLSQPR